MFCGLEYLSSAFDLYHFAIQVWDVSHIIWFHSQFIFKTFEKKLDDARNLVFDFY